MITSDGEGYRAGSSTWRFRPTIRGDGTHRREATGLRPDRLGDSVCFSGGKTETSNRKPDYGWLGTKEIREKALSMDKSAFLSWLSRRGGSKPDYGWLGTKEIREKALTMDKSAFLSWLSRRGGSKPEKKTQGVISKLKGIIGKTNHVKPLHDQSSEDLKRLSEKQYQMACRADYVYTGLNEDYIFAPSRVSDITNPTDRLGVVNTQLSLLKILDKIAADRKAEIQMLDIGCGRGQFISTVNKPGQVKAYGLSAEGLEPPRFLPSDQYIRGNAQNLLKVLPDKQNCFDVISSAVTFIHLPDPLGTLTQAYQLLKPGGILMVDGFHVPGIEKDLPAINQYLQKKGFDACFFAKPSLTPGNPIGAVLIRKSAARPVLDLPVKYSRIHNDRQTYQLDTRKIKSLPKARPESLGDQLKHFHEFRKHIGLPDVCLRHSQDPETQARLKTSIEEQCAYLASLASRASGSRAQPLHQQASEALHRLADAQYREACNAPYVYFGDSLDYGLSPGLHENWKTTEDRFNIRNAELSVDKIIRMAARRANGAEAELLDIGCGEGRFIQTIQEPGKIKAYGITAEGFNAGSLPSGQHIRGNAHHLLKLLPDKQNAFDVIFSQMTLMHLPDPLGVLTQAYELLKPGGILLVDGFHAPGIEHCLPQINRYLEKKGIEARFFREPAADPHFPVGPVLIRKSTKHPVLDLPIKYDRIQPIIYKDIQSDRQTYKPDPQKINVNEQNQPQSLNEMLKDFATFRHKIGLTDEVLFHSQDPKSQAALKELMRPTW